MAGDKIKGFLRPNNLGLIGYRFPNDPTLVHYFFLDPSIFRNGMPIVGRITRQGGFSTFPSLDEKVLFGPILEESNLSFVAFRPVDMSWDDKRDLLELLNVRDSSKDSPELTPILTFDYDSQRSDSLVQGGEFDIMESIRQTQKPPVETDEEEEELEVYTRREIDSVDSSGGNFGDVESNSDTSDSSDSRFPLEVSYAPREPFFSQILADAVSIFYSD